MKDTEFYVGELENVVHWLEEHIDKLAEGKIKQASQQRAVELKKAELLTTANELDENGKPKLKNAELRDTFVLNSLTNCPDFLDLLETQEQIIAEEATVKISDYQFKALIAILGLMKIKEETK